MIRFFQTLSPNIVAIEACGSAYRWARLLGSFRHEVELIAPQLMKPYVKCGKNDAADVEALYEVMSRPTMRFIPMKSPGQQAVLMLMGIRTSHLNLKFASLFSGRSALKRPGFSGGSYL